MEKIIPKEGVIGRLSQSLNIYIKNILIIPFILFINIIFGLLIFKIQVWLMQLDFFVINIEITNIALRLLHLIPFILTSLCIIYSSKKIINGEKSKIKKSILFSVSNFFKYIIQVIKITLLGLWKEILVIFLGFFILILSLYSYNSLFLIIGYSITLIGIIIFLIKKTKIQHSYIIIVNNTVSVKESIKESLIITKGKFWRTFGNIVLFGIIISIPDIIIKSIPYEVFISYMALIPILSIIFNLTIAPIMITFIVLLYKRNKFENKENYAFQKFKNSEEFKKIKKNAFEEFKKNKEN